MLNFQMWLDVTMLVQFSWLSSSSGIRTRHINTRCHFVCEYVKDRGIKIVFAKSSINDADMFTKNVGEEA
jgi:hypothetical protein